jgi:hypothetical protein
MGMLATKNGAIFIICSVLGFLAGHYLPGAWSVFVSILVSYHLFLLWLVLTAEHETGFSLPIGSTILTHTACLALVVTMGIGRNIIPFFWLIRYCIPALAPFECNWLFSGEKRKNKKDELRASQPIAINILEEATAEDDQAWLQYLATRNPKYRKPGLTIKDEYEQWLAARIKKRSAESLGK